MQEERWGDVRDWKNWRERQAALIAQDIVARNRGQWPVTVEEWQEAAGRYGLKLHIVYDAISAPAQSHDDTIVIRHTRRQGVLCRRICHEIAEAVAQREGALRQFNFSSSMDEFHQVAQIVEKDAVRFAAHQHRTARKKVRHIEAQIRGLQEQLHAELERLQASEMLLE